MVYKVKETFVFHRVLFIRETFKKSEIFNEEKTTNCIIALFIIDLSWSTYEISFLWFENLKSAFFFGTFVKWLNISMNVYAYGSDNFY